MKKGTIVTDLDGSLVVQHMINGVGVEDQALRPVQILPGVKEKFSQWQDYDIIIITARDESKRQITIEQLDLLGLKYDHLIMGISTGPRHLINDLKPHSDIPMAVAYNLIRNQGLEEFNLT